MICMNAHCLASKQQLSWVAKATFLFLQWAGSEYTFKRVSSASLYITGFCVHTMHPPFSSAGRYHIFEFRYRYQVLANTDTNLNTSTPFINDDFNVIIFVKEEQHVATH